MDNPNNTQINEHRQMTILSGNLSDFQLKNLKLWPFVVFDNLDKTIIKYDFIKLIKNPKTDEEERHVYSGKVSYDFIFKSNTEISLKTKQFALKNLKLWVKTMFWNDTVVEFKKGGKEWT